MMGRTKPKEPAGGIKRSTQQDEILTIERNESVFRIAVTEEAGNQTIMMYIANHAMMVGGSSHFRPTTDEARAIRDFLTEMLP